MLGWGVLIPLATLLPYYMIEFLDIRCLILKLAPAQLFTVVFFRCIEAMYETSPPVVEESEFNYVIYYTSTIHFIWDPKTKSTVRVTAPIFMKNFVRVTYYFHLLSLSLSVLGHCHFMPFGSPVLLDEFHFNLDLLRPAHIANAYCLAGKLACVAVVLAVVLSNLVHSITNIGRTIQCILTCIFW